MRLEVFPTVEAARPDHLAGRAVVAVDVLRATTTVVTALAHGARGVWPAGDPAAAEVLAAGLEPGSFLKGGERGSFRLPGYDLGNSPLEYVPALVAGKWIVLTTTNGTGTIRLAGAGRLALAAALVNGRAVGAWVAKTGLEVSILCAGTRGEFSLDDVLCAGQVVDAVVETVDGDVDSSDLARAARQLYLANRDDLARALRDTHHGRRLCQLGFTADLEHAARADLYQVVPVYAGGVVTAGAPLSPPP